MSLIQFRNSFIVLILFFTVFGKALTPESYSRYPELIERNDKLKEYYEVSGSGLEYTVKGPAEIKIFSKKAYPKRTSGDIKDIQLKVHVNDLELELNNSKKIDKKTKSSTHPMHVYTYTAKDVIVLPSGTYNIKIKNPSILNCNPTLVRVLRSGRKSKNLVKEDVMLNSSDFSLNYKIHNPEFSQLSSDNNRSASDFSSNYTIYNPEFSQLALDNNRSTSMPTYYVLDYKNPLFIDKSDDFFEVNIRGVHGSIYDSGKIINLDLEKNGRIDTKYHILFIPHPSKKIFNTDYIPSRLNKIYIQSRDEYCELKIKTKHEDVLVRLRRVLN